MKVSCIVVLDMNYLIKKILLRKSKVFVINKIVNACFNNFVYGFV